MRAAIGLTGLLVGLVVLAVARPSDAQSANVLVGTWERVSQTNADGTANPQPAAFVIFSANGHFSQTAVPVGRPKLTKPLQDMTREELLARYQGVQARRGTYSVAGNRLTRKDVTNVNPNQEGTEQVQEFRIEKDMLTLSSADPKSKAQAVFRRVK